MSTTSYLMHILFGQASGMNSDFILVIIPVLSAMVLLLGICLLYTSDAADD